MLLLGGLGCFISSLATYMQPRDSAVVLTGRVVRGVLSTLSSTVMVQAAMADVVSGEELSVAGSRLGSVAGVAVLSTPFIEAAVIENFQGPRLVYLVEAILGLVQLVHNLVLLPETLPKQEAAKISLSWEDVNPFGFVQLYTRGSVALRKLCTIRSLMLLLEGKNIADLEEAWKRVQLGWDTNWCRNEIVVYGICATAAGAVVQPYLLRQLSTRGFTAFTNGCVMLAFCLRGIPNIWPFLGSSFVMLPGVGGSCSTAIATAASDRAVAEGFGKGEFAAYSNNLRGVGRAITPALIGWYYAFCERSAGAIPVGSVYLMLNIVGAILPQLLLAYVSDEELEVIKKARPGGVGVDKPAASPKSEEGD